MNLVKVASSLWGNAGGGGNDWSSCDVLTMQSFMRPDRPRNQDAATWLVPYSALKKDYPGGHRKAAKPLTILSLDSWPIAGAPPLVHESPLFHHHVRACVTPLDRRSRQTKPSLILFNEVA